MERTKQTEGSVLQTLSTVMQARAALASRMGMQFGGRRDIYKALGYPKSIDYGDYMLRYLRQDMAKAVIDRPASVTWQGPVRVVEPPYTGESDLARAWNKMAKDLKLKRKFARVDRLSGIGEYSILLLGFSDVRNSDGWKSPAKKGSKLLYVKPYGQDKAEIKSFVSRTNDSRYGLPETYKVTIKTNVRGSENSREVFVHHSRVIHVVGESLESDVKGLPRLEAIFNRLIDLEKLVGGDAEMFWKGARPGYAGKLDKDYTIGEATKKDLQDQITEYEDDLRRILINEGVDLQALAQQIADPEKHVDAQIQMISAATGIPKRILTGSERGELASTQDRSSWLEYVETRRNEFAEPNIVRPFIDRCIELNILPETSGEDGDYDLVWQDLFVLNEKSKVEVGKGRASAFREYLQNPMAEMIIPPKAFVKFFLGLSEAEQKEILEMMNTEIDRSMLEEGETTEEEDQIITRTR